MSRQVIFLAVLLALVAGVLLAYYVLPRRITVSSATDNSLKA